MTTTRSTLRHVRLADLGWTLGAGRYVRSRVTMATGRVDFIMSLGQAEALKSTQFALCANDVCPTGTRAFGSAFS